MAVDTADAPLVAVLELLDGLDTAPPPRPLLDSIDRIPDLLERRVDAPGGQEAIARHGKADVVEEGQG
jgi:hypothetical protein